MSTKSLQAPKKVRRFRSENRFKGHESLGVMHAGKYYTVQTIYGYPVYFWAGICITPARLEKVRTDILSRTPQGRVLSPGATAPITCSRCIKILQEQK